MEGRLASLGGASIRLPDGGGSAPAPPGAACGGPTHVETLEQREAACCHAEPECVLCPLRPENADRNLKQLWAAGLARTRVP